MKIRQDFVTNSSSVSYIVTFCPPLYDAINNFFGKDRKTIKDIRIEELIKNDLLESGTQVYWDNTQLYVKRYTFNNDETETDELLGDSISEIDFETISEDDLWNYIRGQFLMAGDLGRISGFGVTQVETF